MVAGASSYLNLPSFWLEQPHTWFNMCESAFATRNIVIVILGKSTNRRYLNLKVDSIDKKFCRSTRELAPGYGDLVWVFSKTSTPQCHNIILHTTHTHTLTTTLTFTHTHDWPTVASMTSGSWGFRFLQMGFYGTTSGQQNELLTDRVSHNILKIFSSECENCFICFVCCDAGIMLQI